MHYGLLHAPAHCAHLFHILDNHSSLYTQYLKRLRTLILCEVFALLCINSSLMPRLILHCVCLFLILFLLPGFVPVFVSDIQFVDHLTCACFLTTVLHAILDLFVCAVF